MSAASSVMTPVVPPERSSGGNRRLSVVLAVVAGWALVGAGYAVKSLTRSGATPTVGVLSARQDATHAHALNEDIPTSFGVFAVEIVDKTAGIPPKAIGGATHFPSYTSASTVLVQATLNITNLKDHPVTFSADQVKLISGGKRIDPSRASVGTVRLLPHASIDTVVGFAVPRGGQHLELRFADAPAHATYRVNLGTAKAAGANAPKHSHH